jgi:hypothetical protein
VARSSALARRLLPGLAAAGAACVAGGACSPDTLRLVGNADGVYRPDAGCTMSEDSPACPAAGDPAPQLRFETTGTDPGLVPDTGPGNISNVGVTCIRSYCGTGSFTAHADLEWTPDPEYPQRMASFDHVFDPPLDLMGRTITFYVYVDAPTVPLHAQMGVIYEYWRWVGWTPVKTGWNRVEGVVSPDNPLTGIDPGVTSIPVTMLRLDVYVPVAEASGPSGNWSGEIYFDEIGWR